MQKNNNIGNRCVIYARYSCSNQTEQSIEGQMHDCEQFAARTICKSSIRILTVRQPPLPTNVRNF